MDTPTKEVIAAHYKGVAADAKAALADKSLTQLMDDLDASLKALSDDLKDHRADFDRAIAKLVGGGL